MVRLVPVPRLLVVVRLGIIERGGWALEGRLLLRGGGWALEGRLLLIVLSVSICIYQSLSYMLLLI